MLFVYVAFMGGLVQFCWVFLVDILSSSHSLDDVDMRCRAIKCRAFKFTPPKLQ